MMKNKIYLCCYSTGCYDDYRVIIVFATTNKSKASRWVSKFNKILKKWSYYYSQFEDDKSIINWIKDEYVDKYFDRWNRIRGINNAYMEAVELR